jgi:hypothetical protein
MPIVNSSYVRLKIRHCVCTETMSSSVCTVSSSNLCFIFTSLHVTASTGHHQVQYTQPFLKTITPETDPFLGYTVYYFKLRYVIYYN